VLKELYTRPWITGGFFMARELYVNVRRRRRRRTPRDFQAPSNEAYKQGR
jgi:hypothetical protein